MSHITAIKTELRSLRAVEAALRRLGYAYELDAAIPDYYGNRVAVDVAVHLPDQRAVGFRCDPQSGVYELVGDWFNAKITRQEFLDSLTSSYAREQVLASLEEQGLDVSRLKETEEADGTVVFELPLEEEEMTALLAGAD